jgi:hypothetical protein
MAVIVAAWEQCANGHGVRGSTEKMRRRARALLHGRRQGQ